MKTKSAIEHTNRRRVWVELENIKAWAKRLEDELQKNPDGVVPWLPLESLSGAVSGLIYAAGHVNAITLNHPDL